MGAWLVLLFRVSGMRGGRSIPLSSKGPGPEVRVQGSGAGSQNHRE